MNQKTLLNLIQQGESDTLEFKTSYGKAVIETLVAFSNYKGGLVLVGISDEKEIIGVRVTKETIQNWINEIKQSTQPQLIPNVFTIRFKEKEILILEAIEYPVKPISFKNKYYKRVRNANHPMSLSEVANEHIRTLNSSWDYYTDPNHSLDHISLEKINNYIREYEVWNKTKVNFSPIEFLNKQEILRDDKITYGCYLLFSKELCIVSDIQIGRFKSPTKIIDSLNLDTDIFTELEEIIAFIKKHLMVEFIITGNPQREERYDYPLEAIREVVINMLVHRDYRDSSGSIIKIYDDRIEFFNPGGLYGNLTKEELLNFNYQPQARNKLIAKAFKEIGKVEKYGSGMKRIFTICKEYGIMAPQINVKPNSFELVLFKEKVSGGVNVNPTDSLFQLIKEQPNKRANELAMIMDTPYKTLEKWIEKLRKEKRIEFKGSSKKGGYFVLEKE